VDASVISDNWSASSGGGIWNEDTLRVQNGSIIGGVGAGNTATDFGGGIENALGTTTLDGSIVSANTADRGGGINNLSTLYVQNGTIVGGAGAGNQAEWSGGGIRNNVGGTTTVDASTVSVNTAGLSGGGIVNIGTLIVINGSTISANKATGENGGGISNQQPGTTTVSASRILHNSATAGGGGLHNDDFTAGAADVTGSCIVGNSAYGFYNNQPAEQIASGNWWGAPGGPNSPGADTVYGNVDVMPHLTEPILNCQGIIAYVPLVLR
jgi:hypothetical protein